MERRPSEGSKRESVSVAGQWVDGRASPEQLHRSFLDSTLFLQAGDRPGLLVWRTPPDGLLPVWTSERQMVRSVGAADWFSVTGADLLSLLPAGYDVVVDPSGPAPVRLRLSALWRQPVVVVGWG
jgi:hypothetical protein